MSVTSGFRCVDFRKWFQPRDKKRPETDEKGDRSEFGSMGANEIDRPSDKQRSSRSRRGATMLHARRPPRDVRMSRVLSIPEQWRRAIEALEARAPPDGVATLVNSLQNRVKSITLCVILNAKNGK